MFMTFNGTGNIVITILRIQIFVTFDFDPFLF